MCMKQEKKITPLFFSRFRKKLFFISFYTWFLSLLCVHIYIYIYIYIYIEREREREREEIDIWISVWIWSESTSFFFPQSINPYFFTYFHLSFHPTEADDKRLLYNVIASPFISSLLSNNVCFFIFISNVECFSFFFSHNIMELFVISLNRWQGRKFNNMHSYLLIIIPLT